MGRGRERHPADAQPATDPVLRGPAVRTAHGALACLFGGLAVLAVVDPDVFREAMQEDALAEWASFWLFTFAGIAAIVAAVRAARSSDVSAGLWTTRAPLAAIGLFCLFVAGEEISWGQRFLGFRPPAYFLEANYQQELNLHNLLLEFVRTRLLVAAIAVGYGVLLPLAAGIWGRRSSRFHRWIRAGAPAAGLVPWFMIIALVELAYPISFAGEAAELALGAVFAVDVWIRAARVMPIGPFAFPAGVAAGVLAILVFSRATIVVSGVVAASGDQALVARAESDLDRLGDDLAIGSAIQPSLLLPGRVHQRVFTAVAKDHLRFSPDGAFLRNAGVAGDEPPSARQNRHAYFLDPWHNSYWIFFSRNAGVILLYSMGPNRRRDTPVTSLTPAQLRDAVMEDDDIGVAIELVPAK
ncbi:MAG: hypothetical protein AB1806_19120 [Acidobacteriota bacterium]